jgi:serine/threonine-protein kinase RCK2
MQPQQLTREVERIVREEREAQGKVPVYKGLEHFKLVQKMGECAPSSFNWSLSIS